MKTQVTKMITDMELNKNASPGRFRKPFKKSALALSLALVSSFAFAASLSVPDVNAKVAELVKPFNNATTTLQVAFKTLNFDAIKTLDFEFSGSVAKVGTVNTAKLDFQSVRYQTDAAGNPILSVELNASMDFVKALGQDIINAYANELDVALVDIAKDFTKGYGAALVFKSETKEKIVDAKGDVEALKVILTATLDPAKLPAPQTEEDAEFRSFNVVVTATRTGAHVSGEAVLNPGYRGFQAGQDGMKEYAEKVMADDPATLQLVQYYLAIADSLAEQLVELKP